MILLALPVAWALGDRRVSAELRKLGSRLGFRITRSEQEDDVLLAELTALGLSAGLSFPASLEAAAQHASGPGRDQVRRALRTPEARGDAGPATGLFALADRAQQIRQQHRILGGRGDGHCGRCLVYIDVTDN